MVGHTGNMDATVIGVEAVDLGIARILPVIDETDSVLVITADHGNADQMLERNKKGALAVRTAHSLNPVPFIIYNSSVKALEAEGNIGLANVAATVVELMGYQSPDCWEHSVIKE